MRFLIFICLFSFSIISCNLSIAPPAKQVESTVTTKEEMPPDTEVLTPGEVITTFNFDTSQGESKFELDATKLDQLDFDKCSIRLYGHSYNPLEEVNDSKNILVESDLKVIKKTIFYIISQKYWKTSSHANWSMSFKLEGGRIATFVIKRKLNEDKVKELKASVEIQAKTFLRAADLLLIQNCNP